MRSSGKGRFKDDQCRYLNLIGASTDKVKYITGKNSMMVMCPEPVGPRTTPVKVKSRPFHHRFTGCPMTTI
jgi:hypothetical protein